MSFFSLVSILISLAAVSSYVNYRYIRLPTTVGVMLVALLASLTLVLIGPYAGGFREQAATLVSQIDFNRVVLHGMLAFLLFAGAIHVSLEDLGREWLPVSLLAIFGTLASTCIVGGVTWLVLDWLDLGIPFLHALLFGALISPTDPIAVLAIMKSVGASRQLEVQVAGESLFNDGLGVVIRAALAAAPPRRRSLLTPVRWGCCCSRRWGEPWCWHWPRGPWPTRCSGASTTTRSKS